MTPKQPGGGSFPNAPASVEAIFRSFIGEDTPGAALIATRDGQTLLETAYGLADLQQGAPLTPQSIFHIGSIGKQFTSLALLMLAEAGRLDLDDPIALHLPELDRFGAGVSVRHLLQHTAGIPDYYEDEALGRRLLERSPQPVNADALALLAAEGEPQFAPGEQFSYSNPGYEMLGILLERLSGQPLGAFLQQRVFDPLDMRSTFSLPSPRRSGEPRLAHSYTCNDGAAQAYDSDPLDNLVGSGSIYSTVGDLARYDQALYGETLVKQSTLAEAFRPAVLKNGEPTGYGLGWEVGESNGRPYVGHTGSWLGFKAYYVRFQQERLAVVVLLNRDYGLPEQDPALMVAQAMGGDWLGQR